MRSSVAVPEVNCITGLPASSTVVTCASAATVRRFAVVGTSTGLAATTVGSKAAPPTKSKQAYFGIGKTFKRGEVLFIADWLETGEAEKVTLTLSFTAFLGARVTQ